MTTEPLLGPQPGVLASGMPHYTTCPSSSSPYSLNQGPERKRLVGEMQAAWPTPAQSRLPGPQPAVGQAKHPTPSPSPSLPGDMSTQASSQGAT